ncbi:unnamed protein product [Cyprideis torosa]|uniref:Uncharacterized protein n=1 Tax=Cyprideis torosa TaxID=163714 RepID=A0A7R8W314_9CRUS|nr:unnamed protein product [Cyprideis torosa]CAG0882569.1 unnamed protein product [Cyprideis torosa]
MSSAEEEGFGEDSLDTIFEELKRRIRCATNFANHHQGCTSISSCQDHTPTYPNGKKKNLRRPRQQLIPAKPREHQTIWNYMSSPRNYRLSTTAADTFPHTTEGEEHSPDDVCHHAGRTRRLTSGAASGDNKVWQVSVTCERCRRCILNISFDRPIRTVLQRSASGRPTTAASKEESSNLPYAEISSEGSDEIGLIFSGLTCNNCHNNINFQVSVEPENARELVTSKTQQRPIYENSACHDLKPCYEVMKFNDLLYKLNFKTVKEIAVDKSEAWARKMARRFADGWAPSQSEDKVPCPRGSRVLTSRTRSSLKFRTTSAEHERCGSGVDENQILLSVEEKRFRAPKVNYERDSRGQQKVVYLKPGVNTWPPMYTYSPTAIAASPPTTFPLRNRVHVTRFPSRIVPRLLTFKNDKQFTHAPIHLPYSVLHNVEKELKDPEPEDVALKTALPYSVKKLRMARKSGTKQQRQAELVQRRFRTLAVTTHGHEEGYSYPLQYYRHGQHDSQPFLHAREAKQHIVYQSPDLT